MTAKLLKRILVILATPVVVLLVLFFVGVLWPTREIRPARMTTPLAIANVTVADVRASRLVPSQTVLVNSGRIVAVGPAGSIAIPRTAKILDARGKYLLPALWDMHTHVYAVSPLLELPLYIAYGVTNVRDMQGCPRPGDLFIACPEDKRRWTAEGLAG
jgi:hypothetical protein